MIKVIHVPSTGILPKTKKVVRSTIGAETFSLSGCDVLIYINKLSELSLEHVKRPEVIAYPDNQSLNDAAHTMKRTLEKRLLADTAAIRKIVERNEINIT